MTENNFQMYSAAVSDRGLSEKRPQNEDSFVEMNNLGLFSVADGVGGAQAGDVASQMAMEILGEAFVNLQANGDAEEMMRIAIERANSAIYQMSSDLPQLSTMATTIVALYVSGNIATIGHVGDSRLYRLDAKGSLYRETQDHSVVEEEVRAGRMTAAQAANHPSRNVISRALGAESTVEVDMKTIMFDANTVFLLCSDGITRHINDFEIRELLLDSAAPSEICKRMKDICYSRGAEDNLTAVIIKLVQRVANEVPPISGIAPTIDEEATVATPRPASTSNSPFAANNITTDKYEEIPTRGLEMPAAIQPKVEDDDVPPTQNLNFLKDDDEQYLMDEPAPETVQPASQNEGVLPTTDFTVAPINETPAPVQPKPVESSKDYPADEPEVKKGGGAFSKFLSSVLLLLVGAILGVAAYYVWLTMSAKPNEVPKIPEAQYSNVPFGTFEESRRRADTNPNSIIAQYERTPPRDAADFYLLGRAQVINKRYEDAKKSFNEARNKLSEYNETSNKAVLKSDIDVWMTIAQDPTSQAIYERALKTYGETETNKPSNTQTNTNQ